MLCNLFNWPSGPVRTQVSGRRFNWVEQLGLLSLANHFVHRGAGRPTFSNSVERVSPLATRLFLDLGVLLFFCKGWSRLFLNGFSALCVVLLLFSIARTGRYGLICVLYGVCSVLDLVSVARLAFQTRPQSCSLASTSLKRETRAPAEGGRRCSCGEQVGLRIKRRA